MGDTERCNFNTLVFDEKHGTWWPKWSGGLVAIQAPQKSQVIEKISSEYGSPLEHWNINQLESGHWKAIRIKAPAPKQAS